MKLHLGDCLEVMRGMDADSVDAIVTDPPYGLTFMGKDWDHGVPGIPFWAEALRVAKPGAHLLAFGGTRTYHRLVCAIEDAGWEIRDTIAWVYGSGFPKSHDVSKAIDKAARAEREVVGTKLGQPGYSLAPERPDGTRGNVYEYSRSGSDPEAECEVTAPATVAARQWDGWGTALKPAMEPIVVARKPLIGTVVQNVLEHGTGALNIDGCRVEGQWSTWRRKDGSINPSAGFADDYVAGNNRPENVRNPEHPAGRWPANLVHDGSDEVLAGFPQTATWSGTRTKPGLGVVFNGHGNKPIGHKGRDGDSGSAARFFYCAKASKKDRDEDNRHPTVKPTDLMRYLCRLVTPPGGIVLDPFMGSGSTGKAARMEGFDFIGIEREPEYFENAQRRVQTQAGLPLGPAG